jgi:signal transduction histidine kinase
MKKPLRLLLSVSSEDEAAIVLGGLKSAGSNVNACIATDDSTFDVAVKKGPWDLIVVSSGGDTSRLISRINRSVSEAQTLADVAESRERLLIGERMAAAGTLAAGIAHEINNPLGVAMANIEFLVGAVDTSLHEPLRDVHEALARIRDVVRDVKLFSRPNDDATSPVDVRSVLDSATRLAQREIADRAKLVKDYGPVPAVEANEARLGQAVLNVLVNATQAIAKGRRDASEIRLSTRTMPDGRVCIEVRDTGPCIPRESLERIFDPFFTTKPMGIGGGLGLSICHRIVSDLGGEIVVESEIGKGTCFRILLPAAEAERADLAPPICRPSRNSRRRVLVVDDEETLARAIERNLRSEHDVFVVTRARQALDRIESGERFDIILTDVMMPEVSGIEMYERLRDVAPDQASRVVFLTGGAFTAATRRFLDSVENPIVEKPFEPKRLRAFIAEFCPAPAAV